jgi:hypothetical protein
VVQVPGGEPDAVADSKRSGRRLAGPHPDTVERRDSGLALPSSHRVVRELGWNIAHDRRAAVSVDAHHALAIDVHQGAIDHDHPCVDHGRWESIDDGERLIDHEDLRAGSHEQPIARLANLAHVLARDLLSPVADAIDVAPIEVHDAQFPAAGDANEALLAKCELEATIANRPAFVAAQVEAHETLAVGCAGLARAIDVAARHVRTGDDHPRGIPAVKRPRPVDFSKMSQFPTKLSTSFPIARLAHESVVRHRRGQVDTTSVAARAMPSGRAFGPPGTG